MKRMIVRISEDTGRNVGRESTRCLVTRKTPCTVVALALVAFSTSALATACSDYRERITAFGALISDFEKNGRFDRPAYGPCVREERPTDISQCCEAGRMKLGYLRVCASQRRSRRKTLHFNLLRNPRPTTTLAGRVVLPVFTGVAEFERPLIAIRTEEGRRTARAPDVPFDRRPKLRPDQRSLSLSLTY